MERVDGAPLDRGDGVFDKPRFIQGVGMDADLHIHLIRDRQASVNGGGCCSPVFMQFEAASPSPHLLFQGLGGAGIALAEETQIHRQSFGGLKHPADVECAGGAGGGVGSGGWPGATAEHCCHPAG